MFRCLIRARVGRSNANLIWKIADLLRGPYQPNQYGDVILPFTILRRLDCIREPTKDQVLAEYKKIQSMKVDPGLLLKSKFKLPFYNTSRWTFASLDLCWLVGAGLISADEAVAVIVEGCGPMIRSLISCLTCPRCAEVPTWSSWPIDYTY